jgi:hypothetical protein
MNLDRRDFLKALGLSAASQAAPMNLFAQQLPADEAK